MPYWIIKGHLYTCSNCRTTFNNYFRDMDEEPTCPCCGAIIEKGNQSDDLQKLQDLRERDF